MPIWNVGAYRWRINQLSQSAGPGKYHFYLFIYFEAQNCYAFIHLHLQQALFFFLVCGYAFLIILFEDNFQFTEQKLGGSNTKSTKKTSVGLQIYRL